MCFQLQLAFAMQTAALANLMDAKLAGRRGWRQILLATATRTHHYLLANEINIRAAVFHFISLVILLAEIDF